MRVCVQLARWEIKVMNDLMPTFVAVSLAIYPFSIHGTGETYAILLVGLSGYLFALDCQNGSKRNSINLEGTGFKPIALLVDSRTDTLFTCTSGELRCFRIDTLKQVWRSNLTGMGYCFGHSLFLSNQGTIIIGMNGRIAAVNKSSSNIEWQASLPGCGYNMVSVVSLADPNVLVCGSSGKLYGVDKTGEILWEDGLPGMNYAPICLSTTACDTDFNSTTLPHYVEMLRQSS